jgi:threonine aldolase
MIDLRSDTVTRPTKGMLEAMMNAKVGDDVFGEDPTVIALEEKTAAMFGMEAGIYCPSGTMTNQIAIKLHTQPGDEVICDATAHIYNFESGGLGFNSGIQAKLLQGEGGRITAKQVEEVINPDLDWLAKTSLVSIENTCNRAGGGYYTYEMMNELSALCKRYKLAFHLDGARIFNCLVETGDKPDTLGRLFDSISICLSKGLGAPVGSVLVGSKDLIRRARRVRKVFGGGMRQAGIIAAAGIYALDNNVNRLKVDHKRAAELGKMLSELPYVQEVLPVETNIVIFTLSIAISGDKFEKTMRENGIRVSAFGKQTVRLVTHLDFDDEMLGKTISVLKDIR